MAYATTNRNFPLADSAWVPAAHQEASLTCVTGAATGATKDTGVVGLKWCVLRARIKDLTGVTLDVDTITVRLQVGTGAAITAPEQLISTTIVANTGDVTVCLPPVVGWSENGFQSYKVKVDCSATGAGVTPIVDVSVDCA
jgi:hypothetical protein